MFLRSLLIFIMIFALTTSPPVLAEISSNDVVWCTPDECYESSDDYIEAIKDEIKFEEIEPIKQEIEMIKRELNIQVTQKEQKSKALLYSAIALLSIAAVVIGVKMFKKK